MNGLIVGHTVQEEGMNQKCKNKIWRVDTGMSQAFGSKQNIQVLEITNNPEYQNNKELPKKIFTVLE